MGSRALDWLATQVVFGEIQQNEHLLLERQPEAPSVDHAHLVISVSHMLLIRINHVMTFRPLKCCMNPESYMSMRSNVRRSASHVASPLGGVGSSHGLGVPRGVQGADLRHFALLGKALSCAVRADSVSRFVVAGWHAHYALWARTGKDMRDWWI